MPDIEPRTGKERRFRTSCECSDIIYDTTPQSTLYCFFFFQAEDGIRDYKVTGVQTCALPISHARLSLRGGRRVARVVAPATSACRTSVRQGWCQNVRKSPRLARKSPRFAPGQIGRASCRERV